MKRKYPAGPLNQHKALATGKPLQSVNKADKGGDCNLKGGMGKGGTISSSGDTGGPRNQKVPASRMTPA